MKTLFISLVSSIILICSGAANASTPDFISECMDCHGLKGVSLESDMPTIAGISATFIEETFAAYKYSTIENNYANTNKTDMRNTVESKYRLGDTSRPATDMKKIANKLTEEQVIEAAEYFSKLPFVAAKQDFDADLAKKGEKIHIRKCEKCHENGGSGAEEDAAILAGQWMPYLRSVFTHILDESRDVDMEMVKKVEKLSDEEWEALLNYYASQQ